MGEEIVLVRNKESYEQYVPKMDDPENCLWQGGETKPLTQKEAERILTNPHFERVGGEA